MGPAPDATGRPIYSSGRPYPNYGFVYVTESSARSLYRGFTSTLNIRRQRFTVDTTYTLGYSYDNIGQLKVGDSSVPSEDRGYLYDAAWNLTKRTNNGAVTTFIYDNKNQLTNEGNALTYDDNGNLRAVWPPDTPTPMTTRTS